MSKEAASPSDPPVRKRRRRELATRAHRPLPSAESLWERFDYKPLTGELIWKSPPRQHASLFTKAAGCKNRLGYILVRPLPGEGLFLAHRLIWRWVTGGDPGDLEVDHINLNRGDNRFSNLRLASKSQQGANSPKRSNWRSSRTHSRLKGVTVSRRKSGCADIIFAQIKIRGKTKYLGSFPTEEAAHAAYCEAAKKYHGEFARLE